MNKPDINFVADKKNPVWVNAFDDDDDANKKYPVKRILLFVFSNGTCRCVVNGGEDGYCNNEPFNTFNWGNFELCKEPEEPTYYNGKELFELGAVSWRDTIRGNKAFLYDKCYFANTWNTEVKLNNHEWTADRKVWHSHKKGE